MFKSLLPRFGKPALDPSRVEATFRAYNDERGYGGYHDFCRARLARKVKSGKDNLIRDGIERVTVFGEAKAAELRAQIVDRFDGGLHEKSTEYEEIIDIDDEDFIDGWLGRIFKGALDQKLVRYFKSEYVIYWYSIGRTLPVQGKRRSFLWHCDKGPKRHLKLLLYINGTAEHGGNTEFISRPATHELAKTGYIFGPIKSRLADLSPLAKQFGVAYEPQRLELKDGQGILFEPANLLHRGILPERGMRYVMAFCLLPSPVPWRKAFETAGHTGLSPDYAWHENAADIQRLLAA